MDTESQIQAAGFWIDTADNYWEGSNNENTPDWPSVHGALTRAQVHATLAVATALQERNESA